MQFTFEPKSKKDWLSKVTSDLKGKPIADLDWHISDKLIMSPFAHADDIQSVYSSLADRQHNSWYINEEIHVGQDVDEANQLALVALEAGVTSLSFSVDTTCDFTKLFKGIHLDWIFIHLDAPLDIVHQFVAYVKDSSVDTQTINCSFSLNHVKDSEAILNTLPLAKLFPCTSSTNQLSPEEELADLLVQAILILQKSDEPEGHSDQLYFVVNLSDSFYINIAKIRALKLLWAHILSSSKMPKKTPFIKAEMSPESFSEDVDYTKIKAGAQAIAASIAAVDLIYIPPSSSDEQVEFHTRIARNINHLLQLESFMDRVIDPAAGSYYFEELTDKIATSAWSIFQQTYEHQA